MLSSEYQVNAGIMERFAALIKNSRLAHAYLFIGPDGIGKIRAALSLAKMVNCLEGKNGSFCDRCEACLKIGSGNHPDVYTMEIQEGDFIKIAQVRELLGRAQLYPYEAAKKVFIIKNMDRLTPEGSNALLKTLEEPTDNSLFILTTAVPEEVFDTIKSRCHAIHFFPLSREAVAGHLKKSGLAGPETACLASFAEGCLGKALQLNEGRFFERKNRMIDQMVFTRDNDAYMKEILAEKETASELLDVLLFWFRDLALLKAGAGREQLIHQDRLKELCRMETVYSFQQIAEIIESVVKTSQMLKANLNIKISLTLLREKIWVRS